MRFCWFYSNQYIHICRIFISKLAILITWMLKRMLLFFGISKIACRQIADDCRPEMLLNHNQYFLFYSSNSGIALCTPATLKYVTSQYSLFTSYKYTYKCFQAEYTSVQEFFKNLCLCISQLYVCKVNKEYLL